jgi:TRAP transporter TAXI family solute receptor
MFDHRIRMALATLIGILLVGPSVAWADTARISITTGGTGGVYYPLGGGMANVLSKYVPGLQATAEVTGGSVDNLRLIGTGKSEVGFSMVDSAWDAAHGTDKFKDGKINVRTLMVLYPNRMQIVTVDGTGINKLSDIRGKRVDVPRQRRGVVVLRILKRWGSIRRRISSRVLKRRIGECNQGRSTPSSDRRRATAAPRISPRLRRQRKPSTWKLPMR